MQARLFDEVLGGPHDAQEIPPGLPGAGHLTIYNNGLYTGSSRVVELDLATRRVAWQSAFSGIGRIPFSRFMGSAQRLFNGNTLVCEGNNGRFFQVTKDNKIVWEYINPYDGSPLFRGAVYKIRAYPPEYCSQFNKLPPAAGLAVEPQPMIPADQVASAKLAAEQAARRASLVRLAVSFAILFLSVALSFQLGRRLARRR
jgi:hypothetical protein